MPRHLTFHHVSESEWCRFLSKSCTFGSALSTTRRLPIFIFRSNFPLSLSLFRAFLRSVKISDSSSSNPISDFSKILRFQILSAGWELNLSIQGEKMSSPSKRRDMDVMKLMMSDYAVEPINDGINEFNVEFHGPKDSLYEGGVWKVHVELPDAYPYKSPSIGFLNKIFHPNVDELSGSVCLDVINQKWSPMFDLLNIFEVFLPQLLIYPNPSDPLNGDAASLMLKDKQQYEQKVKEYCERYAKKDNIANTPTEESSDEDISDGHSTASSDDDVAGHVDP